LKQYSSELSDALTLGDIPSCSAVYIDLLYNGPYSICVCVWIPTGWEWLSFWPSRQQQFEKRKNLAYSAEGKDGIIELYVATLFICHVDFACLINTFPF
jgi:hypothetical protein